MVGVYNVLSNDSYPRYEGSVYRPPSEADSLILQVMYGCSYGECTFCGMYSDKKFRVRPFAEIEEDVENLPSTMKSRVDRVFLADGDALALPVRSLVRVLDLLAVELPSLRRISSYANAHSLLKRSEEELRSLRDHGLEMLYLGLESGDEETLQRTCKGVTVAQTVEACQKAKRAGCRLSIMAILGLGGAERSLQHARGTGRALSAIDPDYISLLTLMSAPGASLAEQIAKRYSVNPKHRARLPPNLLRPSNLQQFIIPLPSCSHAEDTNMMSPLKSSPPPLGRFPRGDMRL